MSALAPVALFAYSRLRHLQRTVQGLRADPLAAASDLHVFCDAARQPEQAKAVAEVRRYVRTIEGFRSIEVIERPQNLGLARSIADGVTQLCDAENRVIVVEDDLLLAPGFLGYLNRALDRYADEPRVYQISGYMYPGDYTGSSDAVFLPMISCWGWATWKRAWDNYDSTLTGFERLQADGALRQRLNLNGAYDYFGMAAQQRKGAIDSWGICWHVSVFMREGLVLYPRRSLVQNLGVDASGTHGAGHAVLQPPLAATRVDPDTLQFPASVAIDAIALAQVERLLWSMRPGLVGRAINWLRA